MSDRLVHETVAFVDHDGNTAWVQTVKLPASARHLLVGVGDPLFGESVPEYAITVLGNVTGLAFAFARHVVSGEPIEMPISAWDTSVSLRVVEIANPRGSAKLAVSCSA